MTKRRRHHGTGTIFRGTDGSWQVAIYASGKRIRRRRWSKADAEVALAEILAKHADDLGYHYQARVHAIRRPELLRRGSHYPRSGVTIKVRFLVFDRDGYRCVYCGATADDARLVVDHVQPLADGGTDDLSNLATACKPCNAGKAGRPLTSLPPALAAKAMVAGLIEDAEWNRELAREGAAASADIRE